MEVDSKVEGWGFVSLVPTRQAVLFWDKCPSLGRKCHLLGRLLRTLRAVNEGHGHARYDVHELSPNRLRHQEICSAQDFRTRGCRGKKRSFDHSGIDLTTFPSSDQPPNHWAT